MLLDVYKIFRWYKPSPKYQTPLLRREVGIELLFDQQNKAHLSYEFTFWPFQYGGLYLARLQRYQREMLFSIRFLI